ncbi:MAG TPA: MmgE/PrpD family protein [Lapillicoccus sp.]|nr:MmgE/PrpD family protein [Lapillicoccus sp.]
MTQKEVRDATRALGAWAAGVRWSEVEAPVRERLTLVLLDSLGVTLVGSRLPEHTALVDAWRSGLGPAPLVGAGRSAGVEAAAWLNATAMVRLELDEGNKFAAGHPAAHGLWGVLSLAADLDSSGSDTAAALLVAYEVAARFGRATRLHRGAHPHGSWGVAGAAAGCGRLLGLHSAALAAAIDTGAGMPVAGHFSSALDGNEVRNAWMGASNVSGLAAARLAAAGGAQCTGTAAHSLGELLGTLEPGDLVADLGKRWDVRNGYFKRHAACSYTHPVADVIVALRPDLRPAHVESVVVEIHALGAGLTRPDWTSRLSALFSIPFVAAAAVVHGQVGPRESSPEGLQDPAVRDLARRVVVRESADLTARLPAERAVRVTVRMRDGSELVGDAPNPIGDADHHRLDEADLLGLLEGWLGSPKDVSSVHRVATGLFDAPRVGSLLQELAAA